MECVNSLREGVEFCFSRWRDEGPSSVVVEKLRKELDRPGDKADVIWWFINGKCETEGAYIDAGTLRNRHRPEEINDAFDCVTGFLQDLGKPGIELARVLRTKNRNSL